MAEPPATLQDALAVLETYQRQVQALVRQLDFLGGLSEEVGRARRALDGLKEGREDEIIIPVGANNFVRGKATDKDVAITGIGAGYAVEKPFPDAIERLQKREDEIRAEMERVSQATVQLQQESARLQEELEEAMADTGRGPGAGG